MIHPLYIKLQFIYLKSSPKQNEFLTLTTLRPIDSIYGWILY